jgi:hypothetical protein
MNCQVRAAKPAIQTPMPNNELYKIADLFSKDLAKELPEEKEMNRETK